jgi:hypothetical protein
MGPLYTLWYSLAMLSQRQFFIAGAGALAVGLVVARRKADPFANLPPWRKAMVECAQRRADRKTPYQWGGGRGAKDWGVDCSGLIIACGRETGAVEASGWGSQRMNSELPHTSEPLPGDAVFYGPRHVVIVEGANPKTGEVVIIGSNGGDSSTTSPEIAARQGAFVKRAPINYRTPFQLLDLSPLAVG